MLKVPWQCILATSALIRVWNRILLMWLKSMSVPLAWTFLIIFQPNQGFCIFFFLQSDLKFTEGLHVLKGLKNCCLVGKSFNRIVGPHTVIDSGSFWAPNHLSLLTFWGFLLVGSLELKQLPTRVGVQIKLIPMKTNHHGSWPEDSGTLWVHKDRAQIVPFYHHGNNNGTRQTRPPSQDCSHSINRRSHSSTLRKWNSTNFHPPSLNGTMANCTSPPWDNKPQLPLAISV